MSSMEKEVLSSDNVFLLTSYERASTGSNLIRLEDNGTFSATGNKLLFENSSVHFYVDRMTNDKLQLIYRFRPVSQPTKYLAVSENNIVLKSSDDSTNDCYSFIVSQPNNDYMMFQAVSSSSNQPMYITADKQGDLSLAQYTMRSGQKTWFNIIFLEEHMTTVNEVVVSNANMTIELARMISVEE